MTRLKILAYLGVALGLFMAFRQISTWQHDADVLKACVAAVSIDAPIGADAARDCPGPIAADHQVAIRSRACDAAFGAKPENLYGVSVSCSAQVKTVQAERDVARTEAGRLTTELNQERLGQDAAIDRATASATALAERKGRAAAALNAAPRDGDGLVVCDAQCVRDRWGRAAERP